MAENQEALMRKVEELTKLVAAQSIQMTEKVAKLAELEGTGVDARTEESRSTVDPQRGMLDKAHMYSVSAAETEYMRLFEHPALEI